MKSRPIRPEVVSAVCYRLAATRTLLHFAENAVIAGYSDELLAAIELARNELNNAVACMAAAKEERALLCTSVDVASANTNREEAS